MFHQPRIGGGPDAPQQDEVSIIFIRDNLEIISGLKPPLGAYRLRYYKLAALAQIRRHEV